jgi:hypothetical protein
LRVKIPALFVKSFGKFNGLNLHEGGTPSANFLKVQRIIHPTIKRLLVTRLTRPAWAGFKTAEEGIAIIMSCIL